MRTELSREGMAEQPAKAKIDLLFMGTTIGWPLPILMPKSADVANHAEAYFVSPSALAPAAMPMLGADNAYIVGPLCNLGVLVRVGCTGHSILVCCCRKPICRLLKLMAHPWLVDEWDAPPTFGKQKVSTGMW